MPVVVRVRGSLVDTFVAGLVETLDTGVAISAVFGGLRIRKDRSS